MKLKITFFSDGGHGWAAVKRSLLVELGILNDISTFSYQKGQTVYLEEDSDFTKFVNAFCTKYNITDFKSAVEFKNSYSDNSPIRNYARFNKDAIEKLEVGMKIAHYGKVYTVYGKTFDNKKWIITDENGSKFRVSKAQESEFLLVDSNDKAC